MVDMNLLHAEIVRNGYSQKSFCTKIGMSQSTFIRRKKAKTFNMNEATKIIEVLGIDNPIPIFFAEDLT